MPRHSTTPRTILILCGIAFFSLSCILNGAATLAAPATVTPYQMGTAAVGTTPAETRAAAPTDTLSPTPTPTVVHVMIPENPGGVTRFITDFITKDYAATKRVPGGSDVYQGNRFERPYTSKTMDYLPDVDLTRVEMSISAPWVYITFSIDDTRTEGIGQTMYGVELDLNKDGRGDVLVWGASPVNSTWTTDGVEVWKDSNYDVGGAHPQLTDAPAPTGDGYDQNLFSSGQGADPDLAWIRQSEGGKKIQLAFKSTTVLAGASQFLWNGLADYGVKQPGWFDYNDHFTQQDAGSPIPSQTTLYPLNQLWGFDNTCRDAYGFVPTGLEPGVCMYTGTIAGTIFRDWAPTDTAGKIDNGVQDSGEPVYTMGEVRLGQGACPSAGYKVYSIGSSGQYSFPDIPIGTYCVQLMYTVPGVYGTTTNPVTVILGEGAYKVVNFGVDWINPPV
jgi:hypothetical protein